MDLYEFNSLDTNQQARVTWDQGVHIAERYEDQGVVLLYQLPRFYVEVYYSPTGNEITRLRSFKSLEPLEPYLDQIDPRELL